MENLFSAKGLSLSTAYAASTPKEASDLLAEHACISCGKVGTYISGDKGKLRQLGEVRYYKVGMKCVCGFINFAYLLYNDIARRRNPRIPAAADALNQAYEMGIVPEEAVEILLTETKVLAYQGKLVEAANKARECANRYPDSAAAQFNLGYLLSACGDADGALAHFRRAVDCDPSFTAAWYRIGLLCEEQGQWEEAIRGYETFLKHYPKHQESAKRKQRCEEELLRRSAS